MIPTLNKLDAIVVGTALLAGGIVASLGVLFAKDQLGGVAAILAAWLGPIVTMFTFTRRAEWRARADDASRMDEQEAASVSGRCEPMAAPVVADGGTVHPFGGGGDDPPPGPKGP